MCGSKHTLGDPINYRILNSSSNVAELKHILMQVYDILSFMASLPFVYVCTVWLYTLSQCTAEQNQLRLHIIKL